MNTGNLDINQRVSVAALKAQYEERVALLEKELITAASELGRHKAENVSVNALVDTLKADFEGEKEQVSELKSQIQALKNQLNVANEALRNNGSRSKSSSFRGSVLSSPKSSPPAAAFTGHLSSSSPSPNRSNHDTPLKDNMDNNIPRQEGDHESSMPLHSLDYHQQADGKG